MAQEKTSVQNERQMLAQRSLALAQDRCILAGTEAFAQIYVGLSLYLYESVGTAGSFSLLLLLPYQFVIYRWARWLARRAKTHGGMLFLTGKTGRRCISFLLFLSAMLDAVIVFFGLCAMIQSVMTDLAPIIASAAVALYIALSLICQGEHALPRLARFLRWIIGGMLFYCGAAALPHGQTTHFYPLLGQGIASIGRGLIWMSGAVSAAIAPIVMANEPEGLSSLLNKKSTFERPMLLAPLFAFFTMLISVWLMPYHALSAPYTMGWRMLLITNMTPSVAVWSLEFLALSQLLLLTLAAALTRASSLLARVGGKQKTPSFLAPALSVLLLPFACLPNGDLQQALIVAAPFRAAAAILALTVLTIASFKKSRCETKEREAAI